MANEQIFEQVGSRKVNENPEMSEKSRKEAKRPGIMRKILSKFTGFLSSLTSDELEISSDIKKFDSIIDELENPSLSKSDRKKLIRKAEKMIDASRYSYERILSSSELTPEEKAEIKKKQSIFISNMQLKLKKVEESSNMKEEPVIPKKISENSVITKEEMLEKLRELNPEADLQVFGSIVPYFTSIIPEDELILPEGFYYDKKLGITNKNNVDGDEYFNIRVIPPVKKNETTIAFNDVDMLTEMKDDFINLDEPESPDKTVVAEPAIQEEEKSDENIEVTDSENKEESDENTEATDSENKEENDENTEATGSDDKEETDEVAKEAEEKTTEEVAEIELTDLTQFDSYSDYLIQYRRKFISMDDYDKFMNSVIRSLTEGTKIVNVLSEEQFIDDRRKQFEKKEQKKIEEKRRKVEIRLIDTENQLVAANEKVEMLTRQAAQYRERLGEMRNDNNTLEQKVSEQNNLNNELAEKNKELINQVSDRDNSITAQHKKVFELQRLLDREKEARKQDELRIKSLEEQLRVSRLSEQAKDDEIARLNENTRKWRENLSAELNKLSPDDDLEATAMEWAKYSDEHLEDKKTPEFDENFATDYVNGQKKTAKHFAEEPKSDGESEIEKLKQGMKKLTQLINDGSDLEDSSEKNHTR